MNEPQHPSIYPQFHGDIMARTNLLKWIREFIRCSSANRGYYMEFGVLNGESIVAAYRQLRPYLSHVYGFDSFSGFPNLDETDVSGQHLMPDFAPGAYKGMSKESVFETIVQMSRMPREKLTLIEGDFAETLPNFDRNALAEKGSSAVIHIDCDLYSSTTHVLQFIEDIIVDGTWLLLDDYWCYQGHPGFGQRKAFDEWLKRSDKIGVDPYCNFNGWGRAFIAHRK